MKNDTITASEIADWVYCPEAWRLARTGHESANQVARESGDAHHARKATAETVAGGLMDLGRLLIVAASPAMLVLWWLAR